MLDRQMADRTRPIVRLEVMNRMVTKGYQKGVYERVTKGIEGAPAIVVAAEEFAPAGQSDLNLQRLNRFSSRKKRTGISHPYYTKRPRRRRGAERRSGPHARLCLFQCKWS